MYLPNPCVLVCIFEIRRPDGRIEPCIAALSGNLLLEYVLFVMIMVYVSQGEQEWGQKACFGAFGLFKNMNEEIKL